MGEKRISIKGADKFEGLFASLVISMGEETTFPTYFNEYLSSIYSQTNGLFDFAGVRYLDKPTGDKWLKALGAEGYADGNIAIAHFYYNESADIKTLKDYIVVLIRDYFAAYCTGCGYSVLSGHAEYVAPKKYANTKLSGGEYSIVIYSDSLSCSLKGVMEDIFKWNNATIDQAKIIFGNTGKVVLRNCAKLEELKNLENLFDSIGAKYTIR